MQYISSRSTFSVIFVCALGLLAACVLVSALPARAQEQSASGPFCLSGAPTGVSVFLESELSATVPSVPLAFRFALHNNAPYDISNGIIYAQVLYEDGEDDYIVDQFVAGSDVDLPQGAVGSEEFVWRVPLFAEGGVYRVRAVLALPERPYLPLFFNAQEVGVFEVTVTGEADTHAGFVKENVLADGVRHTVAGAPLMIPDSTSEISVKIENGTEVPQRGEVVWKLYAWSAHPGDESLDEKTEEVKLHPRSTSAFTYEVRDTAHPAYYLIGEYSSNTSHSFIVIPLAREGAHNSCPRTIFGEGGFVSPDILWLALGVLILVLGGWWYRYSRGLSSRPR